MNEIWQEIIRQALERGIEISKGAVPGAKLRQIIAKLAPQFGETYPPPESENEKFRDFLGRFNSLLTILPRDGQDILVAPADKPELLSRSGTAQAQIRDDIFEALTTIPKGTPPSAPWYKQDRDEIIWAKDGELEASPTLVKMPTPNLEQLLDYRREFATLPEIDPQVREELLSTLQVHSALGAFSKILKENGLAHKWHYFQFRILVSHLRHWCAETHVEWREDWIQSRRDQGAESVSLNLKEMLDQQHRIEGFLGALSAEDIKRISVPLDIVLKHLKK